MSRLTDLADAIVVALNGNDFSLDFTAERTLLPTLKLEDADELHVLVAPRRIAFAKLDRARNREEHGIDIGVLQRPGDIDSTHLDPLMDLVEEIVDFMDRKHFDAQDAQWMSSELDPVYAQEHLRQMRQFTSVIRLTYLVIA